MKLEKNKFQSNRIGLKARTDIGKVTNLGKFLIKDLDKPVNSFSVWGDWMETDTLGRYLRHSFDSNTFTIMKDGDVYIYTKRNISANEELTVNYLEVAELINLPDEKREDFGIKDFDYETK